MKWLIGCLLILVLVSAALAEDSPYIAVVGNDIDANTFYLDDLYQQFLYDQTLLPLYAPVCAGDFPPVVPQTRVGGEGCEQFRSNKPLNQPEICDTAGILGTGTVPSYEDRGNPNAVITKQNAGYFEWWIRLPVNPSGEINLCIRCGVLWPNTFYNKYGYNAVKRCAAETGERMGAEECTQAILPPNQNPVIMSALPRITAKASPGPYAVVDFQPFNLTAFRNPSDYRMSIRFSIWGGLPPIYDSESLQALDGTTATRILLKSCMDKCIVVKRPVEGQRNALGQIEHDLEAGDLIQVRLDVPINNTVDIYCNPQSVRLAGKGEASIDSGEDN